MTLPVILQYLSMILHYLHYDIAIFILILLHYLCGLLGVIAVITP